MSILIFIFIFISNNISSKTFRNGFQNSSDGSMAPPIVMTIPARLLEPIPDLRRILILAEHVLILDWMRIDPGGKRL